MERAKFAAAIKAAREKRHWTQAEAAEASGVSVNTWSLWETGKAEPHEPNLRRACEALGLDIEEFDEGVSEHLPLSSSEEVQAFTEGDLTMQLLALSSIYRGFQEIQSNMAILIEEHNMHTDHEDHITRRMALRRLAGIPLLAPFRLSATHPALHLPAEEIINQCAASIAACWELSKSGNDIDLVQAFKGASAYLPTLEALVNGSSLYRQTAASLAGQCYLLKTVLGWHLQGLKEAAQYANQAVFYSKEAQDTPLLLATLDYLAWLHYYDRRGKLALQTIAQAIPMIKDYKLPLSPRLLGGVYSTVALMQARNGKSGTAALGKAAEAFHRKASDETNQRFVYMDYTQADLVLNDGMVRYHQGDHERALASLSSLIDPETLKAKLAIPERSRIEAVNIITLASLKQPKKNMEQTVHTWTEGMQGAKALQSEQRYNEALAAYDIMEAVWPGERHVKELRELTAHW